MWHNEYRSQTGVLGVILLACVAQHTCSAAESTNENNNVVYPYSGFELAHLLKAGGSAAKGFADRAIRESKDAEAVWDARSYDIALHGKYKYHRHKFQFVLAPGENVNASAPLFRIQLIREPCSYYASVWGFQNGPKSQHKVAQKCYVKDTVTGAEEREAARSDFETWFKAVHQGSHIGLMTRRLWISAARTEYPTTIPSWDSGQLTECVRDVSLDEAHRIKTGFTTREMWKSVDCWVDQAHLENDLGHCFDLFMANAPPGAMSRERISAMLAMEKGKTSMRANTNPKGPNLCNSIFNATGTGSNLHLIQHVEKPYFHLFGGYFSASSCCKTSTGNINSAVQLWPSS